MVRAVELGRIRNVGCGRKRCRRCALPPQSKTFCVGWTH